MVVERGKQMNVKLAINIYFYFLFLVIVGNLVYFALNPFNYQLILLQFIVFWSMFLLFIYIDYKVNPTIGIKRSIKTHGKFVVALIYILTPIWVPFYFLIICISKVLMLMGDLGYWIHRKL